MKNINSLNFGQMTITFVGLLGIISLIFACDIPTPTTENKLQASTVALPQLQGKAKPLDMSQHNIYSWKDTINPTDALVNRVGVLAGFTRIKTEKNTFADWLRHLPLKAENTAVYYHDGTAKYRQDVHHAVVDIDTGNRDLQQCADAVMRLKAEYHFSHRQYEKIHFNYTSGDRVSFDDWRYGRKPSVQGSKVVFSNRGSKSDDSYRNFKRYMTAIFSYAGTHSLEKELTKIPLDDLQIGDVFIQGGFPGHAVIVVDVAQHEITNEKHFLLAQSYMPAQDMHLLKNHENPNISPWFSTDFGVALHTPEWTFKASDLRRF